MNLFHFLTIKRCKRCLHEIESFSRISEQEKANMIKAADLRERESNLLQEKELIREKENLFVKREQNIEDGKIYIAERELYLKKREDNLWAEKEKMVGTDNLETKRQIILPSLQQKWEAEKMKIDAERIAILNTTPKVWQSLESRKKEIENIIQTIKSKPLSTPNQAILSENTGRMKELTEIISLIDKEKTNGYVQN